MFNSLRAKLTSVTCGVLLVAMTLFAVLTTQGLQSILLQETVNNVDRLSETLIRVTHLEMLRDDRAEVFRMFRDVQRQEGIERIRLVRKDGTIVFSTEEAEVGGLLDKSAEACTMCHAGERPLLHVSSMNRSRIFRLPSNEPVVGLAKAIYNEPACYTAPCHVHPANAKILGVIDIIVTLQPMYHVLDGARSKIIFLTLALVLLIAGALTIFSQKLVNRPIRTLLQHTNLVAAGQLSSAIETGADDELGELSRSFNRMTESLRQARAELEELNRSLESKVESRTQEITVMQAQLLRSEKLASLGELVAGIAHEINNPLTGILVFSSLMRNDQDVPENLRRDLETIIRETERCAGIVRGLLNFSRGSVPRKSWTCLNQALERALALVEHQTLFHDIRIERNYHPELPEVLVDPGQMEQVFVNMILNAGQAMSGFGVLIISTGCTQDGGWIYAKVSDSGCGISEEHLSKIFDPFFTTKEHHGTGLGLSVSYGIVKNHGGSIEVQSIIGSGTTFTVEIPLLQESLAENTAEIWLAAK